VDDVLRVWSSSYETRLVGVLQNAFVYRYHLRKPNPNNARRECNTSAASASSDGRKEGDNIADFHRDCVIRGVRRVVSWKMLPSRVANTLRGERTTAERTGRRDVLSPRQSSSPTTTVFDGDQRALHQFNDYGRK
jgi:hypothetical protein